MSTIKTPEQIADNVAWKAWPSITPMQTEKVYECMVKAVKVERAYQDAMRPWQVLTGGTARYPLQIVGAYQSKFEAEAVAAAWNRVNNKHGIRYRVEEDA